MPKKYREISDDVLKEKLLNLYNEHAEEWNRREVDRDMPLPSMGDDWCKIHVIGNLTGLAILFRLPEDNTVYSFTPRKRYAEWYPGLSFKRNTFKISEVKKFRAYEI